jgi:hypothetical protein
LRCIICRILIDSIEEAIEAARTPYFYEGGRQHEPVCRECSVTLLQIHENGETEVTEEDLQELFSAIIADVISGTRELKLRVHTSTHALQIMALAARIDFDLFILLLNNIVFPTANMPGEERVTHALKFVAQLKARYQKPIIGLYGWPREEAYGRRAKMAGADFVFIIPEKPLKLRAAVADCLEPILNAGVDTELLEAKEPKGETYGKPSSTE